MTSKLHLRTLFSQVVSRTVGIVLMLAFFSTCAIRIAPPRSGVRRGFTGMGSPVLIVYELAFSADCAPPCL